MKILDRLEKLEAEATPLPWYINESGGKGSVFGTSFTVIDTDERSNLELTKAAINALPHLIKVGRAAKTFKGILGNYHHLSCSLEIRCTCGSERLFVALADLEALDK